jgi:alkylation response protein AidB-like acyl-CoA dehydrogenase
MVDFLLTEEQKALQRLARDFARKEIKPVAAERDRVQDPTGTLPWDVIEKASRLGLRTLALPKEGLRFPGVQDRVGELYLADIGVPPDLYQKFLGVDVGPLFARSDLFLLV